MKSFTILVIVLFFSFVGTAQEQTNIIQTLSNTSSSIKIALDGKIKITEWDKPYVRVSTNIAIEGARKGILKHLITASRYELSSTVTEGVLLIEAPKLKKDVTIQGKRLKEAFDYEIFVPKSSHVVLKPKDKVVKSL